MFLPMKPYYQDDKAGIEIYLGDCREMLANHEFQLLCDSVLSDPPYGLSFMGKEWDHGVPGVPFWETIKAALKPGAMLLAFGGTRTFHRLTCAIEDAGFEIRDCLMWLYGSGFPKSLDISKAIDKGAGAERPRNVIRKKRSTLHGDRPWMNDPGHKFQSKDPITAAAAAWSGWGTALKPAWEPIILAMKPLDGTFAQNAEKHGVAGLNVDGGRIGTETVKTQAKGASFTSVGESQGFNGCPESTHQGRWPANLILDEESAAMLDEQSKTHGAGSEREAIRKCEPTGNWAQHAGDGHRFGDTGGASRFFYVAKASGDGRGNQDELDMPLFNTKDPGLKNIHPTVKPLDLMEKLILLQTYLCKLTSTPIGGIVLDPFMGSGSTLIAAKRCGRPAIGIELEEKYAEIAANRLEKEAAGLFTRLAS